MMAWTLIIILTFHVPQTEMDVQYITFKKEDTCRTAAIVYRQSKFSGSIKNIYAQCFERKPEDQGR